MKGLFDPERRKLARQYCNYKRYYRLITAVISFLFWLVFFLLGSEYKLYELLRELIGNEELLIFGYIAVLFVLFSIYNMLINYYFFYKLNRKFDLTRQKPGDWLKDKLKISILNFILFYAAARVFLFLVYNYPGGWWYIITGLGFVLSAIMQYIFPVLLLPLFFKLTPYPEGKLRERLENLVKKVGIDIDDIYEINLSLRTTGANAGIMGFGKTRKIVLGDTLDNKYKAGEIEAILAHELGHYVHKDIVKEICLYRPFILLTITYLMYQFLPFILSLRGYSYDNLIISLPLFILTAGIIEKLLSPLYLQIKKNYERRADSFAVSLVDEPEQLKNALIKIADDNLAPLKYTIYEKYFVATHPSIGERIRSI